MSTEIKAQNSMALASVKAIYEAAEEANNLLDGMQTAAEEAGTTLDGIYADAEQAKTSAESASEYAARALGNLSTVQSVAETLNWITSHGTMTLTTDTALDPSHVYFVADPNGDYTVGGNRYSVVTDPNVADISTYYELSIDESLNNYVATHLVVDTEGLWIVPDAGGNKVLIATGSGSTYSTAGTYIVGSGGTVLASFTANGVQIGQTDDSHLEMDYRSMKLIDNDGNVYLHVYDLVDNNGQCTDVFTGDGTNTVFTLTVSISEVSFINDIVLINGEEVSRADYTVRDNLLTFDTPPNSGSTITCKYHPHGSGWYLKAYTLGRRRDNSNAGAMSFVEGDWNVASGSYSHAEGSATEASYQAAHAEGDHTIASGFASHAEGYGTVASGILSHAQNESTIAQRRAQTALGEHNIADTGGTDETTRGDYIVIIGNGTGDNNRSNALTVDWSGNVVASGSVDGTDITASGDITSENAYLQLDTTATSGTDKEIYDALVSLGWDSDVIV